MMLSNMRVLLINHFPLEGSGSGTYTRDVAIFLHKLGHEVAIIFPENAACDEVPGVQLYPLYFRASPAPEPAVLGDANASAAEDPAETLGATLAAALPFNFPCFTTHPRSLTTFASLSQSQLEQYLQAFDQMITRVVEAFCPDIIHVQHIWLLANLALKHRLPCVITAHGTDLMGYEQWPQLREPARQAAEGCDQIISISTDNYRLVLDCFPEVAHKTRIMANGYNDSIFFAEQINRQALLAQYGLNIEAQKLILFAGKFTQFKGIDILLQAAQLYERSQPGSFVTLLAGSGEEDARLKQLALDLGLESVYFLGHRNQLELRQLYSSADVFVMPSRSEAFGLVALEAMACGLPVVASNVGGLPDFINTEVGHLVPACDPQALSKAILNELTIIEQDPGRKAQVASYALENYSMTHYANALEQLYKRLLSRQE